MPAKPAKKGAKKSEGLEVPKRLSVSSEKRDRKEIARYTDFGDSSRIEKPLVIHKGKGKKLGDCENVAKQIAKKTRSDPLLKKIHTILLGRVNKQTKIKDNLHEFSGVVYADDFNREKLEAKLDKQRLNDIRAILHFFGQEAKGTKEECIEHLVNFLEKPAASDLVVASPKKRKRSASPASRSKSPSKKSKSSKSEKPKKKRAKKDPNAPKRNLSAYMFFAQDKRESVVKEHGLKGKEAVTEAGKLLGAMWHKVSASDKDKYQAKADKDKERYVKEKKKYDAKK